MIVRLWNSIILQGIVPGINKPEGKRIILTNQLSLVSALITVIYTIVFFATGLGAVPVLFELVLLAVYCCIILLNKFQLYRLTRYCFIAVLLTQIFILSSFFGEKAQVHSLYIPAVMIPFVLFDKKEKATVFLFVAYGIFCSVLLYATHFSLFPLHFLSEQSLSIVDLLSKITSLVGGVIIIYSFIVMNDKTEQQLDQDNLFLQTQVQAIFDNSADALFLVDSKKREIVKINQRVIELFEGESENDFLGIFGVELHQDAPSEEKLRQMQAHLVAHRSLNEDFLYRTKRGRTFWGSLAIRLITINDRMYQSVRITDISEQKKYEENIKSSLKEKEILLSEIHHRVKNNLAIVSGLLSLQEQQLDDEKAKNIFTETKGRIQSMALIHNKLYQTQSFSSLSFADYAHDIAVMIKASYDLPNTDIRLVMDCDAIHFNINKAIPCGLILNELITNAFKHAFHNRSDGTITISLKLLSPQVVLTVRDDGRGLEDVSADMAEATSMGMNLLYALSEQLDGSVAAANDGGAVFTVRFPLE